MSARELITEHLELWTEAVTKKSSSGRGSNGKVELTGVKKLRELILELAVRGKLVNQDKEDEPVSLLLEKIESEKSAQLKAKAIRKPKKLPEVQEIEQPFPIPDSWRYCRLNELGVWGSGATPKRGNARYYGGGIPWFKSGELYKDFIDSSEETITELAVQETSVRMNQPGDVLLAMYGATIGKASILEVAGTTNQAVCACTPWPGISNRFLLLLLKAYRSRFIALGAGGAQPNISREKIIATVIGLPSEQEQHRIVQKVDELTALCDRLEQQTSDQLEAHETLVDTLLGTLTQSENASELADNWARLAAHFDTLFTTEQSIDKLKQTILQLAVMGRLVEQDSGDEPASDLLDNLKSRRMQLLADKKIRAAGEIKPVTSEDQLFPLPTGWAWCRFEELIDPQFTISYGVLVPGADATDGVPLIRVADLSLSPQQALPEKRISPDVDAKHAKTRLVGGEILLCVVGSIGKIGIAPRSWAGANIARAICRLMPAPLISKEFLLLLLQTDFMQKKFGADTRTLAQPTLNVGLIKVAETPLPPIAEQHRLVQKVDELMTLCDQLKSRLNQASETRNQIAEAVVEGALN